MTDTPEALAEKVRGFTVGRDEEAEAALDALLARLAEAEAKVAGYEDLGWRLSWMQAVEDRDRLKAALERLEAGRFNGPLHAIGIAREALNPRPTSIRAHIDQEGST